MPLSSHTNRIGTGSFWNAAQADPVRVRGDGARLRRNAQGHAPEHFVTSAGNGVVGGSGQGKKQVLHSVHRRLPRPLEIEGSAPVVKQRGIGGTGQPAERGIAFMASAANRVVALASSSQLVRLDIDQPTKKL